MQITQAETIGTDRERGLSGDEAARRLSENGPNRLPEKPPRSRLLIFLDEFRSVLIIVLLVAAVLAAVLGDIKDAAVIVAIVILNAVIGYVQEERAEKAIHALQRLSAPSATVLRDGRLHVIKAEEVVAGDILHIEAGDLIAADGRLLSVTGLHAQESMLTGESMPVEKSAGAEAGTGPGMAAGSGGGSEADDSHDDRRMVYMGTVAVQGHGVALVVETAGRTRLGQIAGLLEAHPIEPTPLQRRLSRFGSQIAMVATVVAMLVFALGLLRGEAIDLMFLTALSLLVAAVPEALPAVVTLGLAMGAQRMVKRHAIVRKLPAAETLGSVTVICTDKTGTLTRNRMMLEAIATAGADYRVTGELDAPVGDIVKAGGGSDGDGSGRLGSAEPSVALTQLLTAGALCNHAELTEVSDGRWEAVGDPMETALLVAAGKMGLRRNELRRTLPLIDEMPFDSRVKTMTTVHKAVGAIGAGGGDGSPAEGGSTVIYIKGAFEQVLSACDGVMSETGERLALSEDERGRLGERAERMAEGGLRVLGLATGDHGSGDHRTGDHRTSGRGTDIREGLTFLGLAGFLDPPRAESAESVRLCQGAGIRPVMITGDHPLTAADIATRVGILGPGDRVMTGQELAGLSEAELARGIGSIAVFARTSPEQKVKIVQAYKSNGEIVAMTGDGVNDAPALQKADIGVAMGISGTEVSKEAADIVLADDDFATIVAAVAEGRRIYDNIRRFVRYVISCNTAEVVLLVSAPLLGMPLPLLPIHILWLNLVTDGLPGLALAVEPMEKDAMSRRPRDPKEQIVGRGLWQYAAWSGGLIGGLSIAVMVWAVLTGQPAMQTLVFTSMCFMELAYAMGVRSSRQPLLRLGLRSNLFLFGTVVGTALLQLAIVYLAPLQAVFDTQALSLPQLGVAFGSALLVLVVIEAEKWFRRARTPAYSEAAPAR